jgi:hypothetical protein
MPRGDRLLQRLSTLQACKLHVQLIWSVCHLEMMMTKNMVVIAIMMEKMILVALKLHRLQALRFR